MIKVGDTITVTINGKPMPIKANQIFFGRVYWISLDLHHRGSIPIDVWERHAKDQGKDGGE